MFRPLYYLGCKAAHAEIITSAIQSVDPSNGRLCDLFAGTGSVGVALSHQRDVTAIDIQEYSRVICSAQLRPTLGSLSAAQWISKDIYSSELRKSLEECLSPLIEFEERAVLQSSCGVHNELLSIIESLPIYFSHLDSSSDELTCARNSARKKLEEAGLWTSPDSAISRYFGGIYFSYRQAAYLDAAIAAANIDPSRRDSILAACLSAASSLVNTIGKQFAQPIRPRDKSGAVKQSLLRQACRDKAVDPTLVLERWLIAYATVPTNSKAHRAVRCDCVEALTNLDQDVSVVYADPPYTRDHYSRFYHVLETMCLRDEPTVAHVRKGEKTAPSRGLYRQDRHQSDFCIRSKAPQALRTLMCAVRNRNIPLVLSYSPHETGDGTHPRVLSTTDIYEIARDIFNDVNMTLLDGSTHQKLNKVNLALTERRHAEVIFTCR